MKTKTLLKFYMLLKLINMSGDPKTKKIDRW